MAIVDFLVSCCGFLCVPLHGSCKRLFLNRVIKNFSVWLFITVLHFASNIFGYKTHQDASTIFANSDSLHEFWRSKSKVWNLPNVRSMLFQLQLQFVFENHHNKRSKTRKFMWNCYTKIKNGFHHLLQNWRTFLAFIRQTWHCRSSNPRFW